MQPNLLAKAISAISKDITLEEFRAKSGIAGKTMARYVLDYLVKNGIGESFRHCYSFSNEDRMKLAVLALQSGTDIEMISKSLSWQDFEAFASQLFNLSGYVAECNLNFSKPSRMQIDVVGINYDSRLAIVVDCKHWPTRLGKTKDLGAEVINFDNEDPVDIIRKETSNKGVICIDAVGYEAVGHMADNASRGNGERTNVNTQDDKNNNSQNHDHSKVSKPAYEPGNPLQIITWMCQAAKKFSTISIPGVYGSAYDQFPLGLLFNRNIQIKMGQCPVKKYDEQLLHLIETRRIDPTKIISHTMKLDQGPKGYESFDKKEEVTKIVLKP